MHNFALKTIIFTLACLRITKCLEMEKQTMSYSFMQSSLVRKSNMVAKIDGELILGGLFSLHRRNLDTECAKYTSPRNIMRVEAMLYAVEEINNDTSILPNITLGAEIRDDCYSSTVALEESLHFVLNAFGQRGKICTDPNNRPPPIMGVVGTVSSQVTTTVASLLRLFRLPQVSYGATTPDLSDRDEYEYFVRTVPSDVYQAKALIDIITQLGWSAVFLISSSGNYGEKIREEFVGLAANHNTSLCIVEELKLGAPKGEGGFTQSKLKTQIGNFLRKIKKWESVRGVVLLTESSHTHLVLKTVKNKGIELWRFKWLGIDSWGVGQPLSDVEEVASGAISIALHVPSPASLKKFYDHFRALKPGTNLRNPWFDLFWKECVNNTVSTNSSNACPDYESNGKKDWNDDDKVPYVFDSVYAFAHSLDALLRTTNASLNLNERLEELSENGAELLDDLLKTNFTGKSGNVRFDRYGNGVRRYDIMSYVNRTYTKIAVWNEGNFTNFISRNWFEDRKKMINSSSHCGQECQNGEGRVIDQDDPSCCWHCEPCSSKEYVNSDSECQSCAVDERPNRNRTGCERLPEDGPTKWVIVLLTIWGCLGLISTAFVAFTMCKFYSTPLIMASGRELMLVLLAGIALSFLLGFALLGEPSTRRCIYQRFGSGVFLAVCYSAILVKTNRIARIFRGRHRPAFITRGPQLLITALLVSIQVGISLIASFFGTTSEVTELYEPDHLHMICRTSGMEYIISISYNVLLLLLCTVYAFLTRKLPANFNEAKLVGITMYTTCVQWICFIPLFYGTRPVYQTSVLLLNSCFNATVLLVGMFGQKVYVVWLRPKKNTRQASNPRGRNGSTTSVSGHSIHMDDVANGNVPSEKGSWNCGQRFNPKASANMRTISSCLILSNLDYAHATRSERNNDATFYICSHQ